MTAKIAERTEERTDEALTGPALKRAAVKVRPILLRKGFYAEHRGVCAAMVSYWQKHGRIVMVGDKVDRDASDEMLDAAIARDLDRGQERARVKLEREPGKPGRRPRADSSQRVFVRRVADALAAHLGIDASRVLAIVRDAARRASGDLTCAIETGGRVPTHAPQSSQPEGHA